MNDSLLEIFDRRQYDADVSRLIGLATATNPLSLAVIDLDKLKVVNDTYGHAAGDEVLKKVASVVRLGPSKAAVLPAMFPEQFLCARY